MNVQVTIVNIGTRKTIFRSIVIIFLFASFPLGNNGNAQQSIKDVYISVNLEQATVLHVFTAIQDKTEFKFIYEKDVITSTKHHEVTLKVDGESVANVLKTILKNTDLTFHQQGTNITIKVPPVKNTKPSKKIKLLPAKVVSGTITAKDGAPLEGTSILIKGTTLVAIADIDGKYALNVDDGDILVYSFIGYVVQEIAVANQSVIDVVMQEDLTNLGDVVINAGCWKVNERENTGNIAKVSATEIEKHPVANPLLRKITGVSIQHTTSLSGRGFNIQFRGLNSLQMDSGEMGYLPYYEIDGISYPSQPLTTQIVGSPPNRVNLLISINPMDIESIEVLKDANATAIYGSKGAKGIVRNTMQYLKLSNEAFKNDGVSPAINNLKHPTMAIGISKQTNLLDT